MSNSLEQGPTPSPIGRRKATDFPQELLNLFDRYVHGEITRRAFLDVELLNSFN
jgi:hypothetical protein